MKTEAVLDTMDYEKILDFAMLDPFVSDYYKNVLSLLKTNFRYNLVAFTSWTKDHRIASCFSLGFSNDFMHQAHNIYIHDHIKDMVIQQYSSNSWNGIFYSQETDPYSYSESKTIDYLRENHIHYFAIMILSRYPRLNIILCKTDKEGPFSQREKKILQKLYDLISQHTRSRETHITNKQVLEIINNHCVNKQTGVIVTDADHVALTYNKVAYSLNPSKLNPKNIDDIVTYVFSLFSHEDSEEPDWEEYERSVNKNGRCYTLEEFKLTNEEGTQSKYYLITIRKNKRYDNRMDFAASAEYGLTEREMNVAQLMVSGYSNSDIAEKLCITISTVKIHVSNIFRKLHVHNRMQAIIKLSSKT